MSQMNAETQKATELQPLKNWMCFDFETRSLITNMAKLATRNEKPNEVPEAMLKPVESLSWRSVISSSVRRGNGSFITVIVLVLEFVKYL